METTSTLDRLHFFDVFSQNSDGSLTPKMMIKIGGVEFGPGVFFTPGVMFGGVNIFQYIGKDIAIEKQRDLSVIKGFYL